MVLVSMILGDPSPGFQGHMFLKSKSNVNVKHSAR